MQLVQATERKRSPAFTWKGRQGVRRKKVRFFYYIFKFLVFIKD